MAKPLPKKSPVDARLRAALAERDAALAKVAQLSAQLDALRLATSGAAEPEVPQYPVSSGVGPAPLRYVLVDQANDALRSVLGPVHGVLRSLVAGRGKS